MLKMNWIFLTLLMISTGFVAILWAIGSYLTKPAPAKYENVPAGVEVVSFSSESGSQISGWIYAAKKPVAVAVLMHGIRSNRTQMQSRAEHLLSLGITSLVFDFQAHGESAGDRITLGYLESYDAQAAIKFMNAQYPTLPTVAIGVSMGGAAILMAKPVLDVDVLILESVYSDMETAISNRLAARIPGGRYLTPLLALQLKPRIGIAASQLSPMLEAASVTVPTLVLSGEHDLHTTVSDVKQLYEPLPKPKRLVFFEGAGHVDLEQFDSKQYWRIVEAFLGAHLKMSNDNKNQNDSNHSEIMRTELIHNTMEHNGMKHGQKSHGNKMDSEGSEHSAHEHDPVDVSDWPLTPSLTLTAHKDLMSGWNLNIAPANFTFAPTRINTADNSGEGHAHLYINGQKVTRVYSPWFYINNLPVGLNTITVTLNANNHGPLMHRGEIIAASVEVLQE